MVQITISKSNLWKIAIPICVFLILLIAGVSFTNPSKISAKLFTGNLALIQPALAENIYPLFLCPCCGEPLDKKNICCPMAEERIGYVDSLAKDYSEKDVMLKYVKKYGVNSFADPEKAKEMRDDLVKAAPADRPIISLIPDLYDFGNVSQKGGKVYAYFTLKNEGKSDLAVNKLETSCGCTFAAIIFDGKESPFFTMAGHGSENPDWEGVVVPAGQSAQLKVMYNPDVHADFRGPATREISVYSNDPIDFEKKVTVELNQAD